MEVQSYITAIESVVPHYGLGTSFLTSFLTILVCEIGDKTFFLAMIMAMKYNKWIVFAGGYGALAVMTILSTIFGAAITALVSKFVTDIVVTVLFLYFGIKMLYDAYHEEDTGIEESEELKEVQQELQEIEEKRLEERSEAGAAHANKVVQSLERIIFWQAFSMTFLAEWGDRSQIATIALAASYNAVMVTLGALLGHFLCTMAAVELGKWISQRVKERTVHIVGGIVFILSGIVTLISMNMHKAQGAEHQD